VTEERVPNAFVAAMADVFRWLEAEGVPGAVIGGVAASLLGRARYTKDVDVFVVLDAAKWDGLLRSAAEYGLVPRIRDPLGFARGSHMFLLRHLPSGLEVDIQFGMTPLAPEIIARRKMLPVGGLSVPVATPEDLIILKALAWRDRDIGDVSGLLDACPNLDMKRVKKWLGVIAKSTDESDMLEELNKLLARRETSRLHGRGRKRT